MWESAMTNWGVIRWWELRRLLYNAILLPIGIASVLGMMWLMEKVTPGVGDDFTPFLGIVLYGFMANLCYTLGWIVELIGRRKDEAGARLRARELFIIGLGFSCLLTSTPFWFGLIYWLTHRSR
jgi:hypothetical protein